MATKGEVRRGVEKYLRSKFSDYNNSIGQFDRVIMAVLSTMGSTLLQPDDPKFDHHIGLETERMLKKYGPGTDYYNERFGKKGKNKDTAMEYDPVMCMMVPAKDQKTADKAIKSRDREVDIQRIADYLYSWEDISSSYNPCRDIIEKLDKEDTKSKSAEEFANYVHNNYKKYLDDYYKKLEATVNKMLKNGYSKIDNYLKSYK